MSEYNGWANYPTWCVNLWLSNDESLYNETRERLRLTQTRGLNRAQEAIIRKGECAQVLKEFVRDELAPDLGASFAADLLGYALDEVDWDEIAAAWLES